jgi:hypothetical protein
MMLGYPAGERPSDTLRPEAFSTTGDAGIRAIQRRFPGARQHQRPFTLHASKQESTVSLVTAKLLQFGLAIPPAAGPGADPVGEAREAERLGFDFVGTSDHPCGTSPSYET